MLSEHDLRHALERVGREAPVRFDEVTGSTQATALQMAADGAPEWTLVGAGHQTAGRGRLGRGWLDVPGSALLLSIVLRPALDPDDGGLLSLLAGASLARACSEVAGRAMRCRWPNDLVLEEHKVGGILAESVVAGARFEHVILGLGINLGSPPSDIPDAGAVDAPAAELLEAFLVRFVEGYRPSTPDFADAVLSAYRPLCATLGRPVRATVSGGEVVDGVAEAIDDRGGLVVRTSAGAHPVRFGTIEHLR